MEPEPSGSAEYNSYRISEDSTNNSNPLTTTPVTAQSQLTNFSPWSTASFNFPSSVSSPSPAAEGQHVPGTPRLRPLGPTEGSFSSVTSSLSFRSSDDGARRPSSGPQRVSLPGIPEDIPSQPRFPWSHSQWLGSNPPIIPSQ